MGLAIFDYLQKWVQPLQRRVQPIHEAHLAGVQPREAREIRPDEVSKRDRSNDLKNTSLLQNVSAYPLG